MAGAAGGTRSARGITGSCREALIHTLREKIQVFPHLDPVIVYLGNNCCTINFKKRLIRCNRKKTNKKI
jgi:hypothetical protein